MPTPENIKLQVRINGGAWQTHEDAPNGITVVGDDVVEMRVNNDAGISQYLFQIWEYPTGFSLPAGWTQSTDAREYHSTSQLPSSFTVPTGTTIIGDWVLRVVVNNAQRLEGGETRPAIDLIDTIGLRKVFPSGLQDIPFASTDEFDQLRPAGIAALKHNFRLLDDLAVSGGAGQNNVGENVGDGADVYKTMNGVALQIRGIKGLGRITSAVNGDNVELTFDEAGLGGGGGDAEPNPITYDYIFDDSTGDANPGAGKLRFSNATPSSAAWIYANLADNIGRTLTGLFDAIIEANIRITKADDPTQWHEFDVTAQPTSATGYRKLPVTWVAGEGDFDGDDELRVQITRLRLTSLPFHVVYDEGDLPAAVSNVITLPTNSGIWFFAAPVTLTTNVRLVVNSGALLMSGTKEGYALSGNTGSGTNLLDLKNGENPFPFTLVQLGVGRAVLLNSSTGVCKLYNWFVNGITRVECTGCMWFGGFTAVLVLAANDCQVTLRDTELIYSTVETVNNIGSVYYSNADVKNITGSNYPLLTIPDGVTVNYGIDIDGIEDYEGPLLVLGTHINGDPASPSAYPIINVRGCRNNAGSTSIQVATYSGNAVIPRGGLNIFECKLHATAPFTNFNSLTNGVTVYACRTWFGAKIQDTPNGHIIRDDGGTDWPMTQKLRVAGATVTQPGGEVTLLTLAGSGGVFPGYPKKWSTSATNSDPGVGYVRANQTTFGATSALYVDNQASNSADTALWLAQIRAGQFLRLASQDTLAYQYLFLVSANPVSQGGYVSIDVIPVCGNTSTYAFAADEELWLLPDLAIPGPSWINASNVELTHRRYFKFANGSLVDDGLRVVYTAPGGSIGAADTVHQTNASGTADEWQKIFDANIDASANIAVSKLAIGASRTLLQGTGSTNAFTTDPEANSFTLRADSDPGDPADGVALYYNTSEAKLVARFDNSYRYDLAPDDPFVSGQKARRIVEVYKFDRTTNGAYVLLTEAYATCFGLAISSGAMHAEGWMIVKAIADATGGGVRHIRWWADWADDGTVSVHDNELSWDGSPAIGFTARVAEGASETLIFEVTRAGGVDTSFRVEVIADIWNAPVP